MDEHEEFCQTLIATSQWISCESLKLVEDGKREGRTSANLKRAHEMKGRIEQWKRDLAKLELESGEEWKNED
jgi:hypothetical protein